jgi:protein involved in polysaccharide export with SLBB domain
MHLWIIFSLIINILTTIFPSCALPQASSSPPKSVEVKPSGYPVVLGDQVLFYVQGIKALHGNERAAGISGRIKRLAEDYAFSADSLTVVDAKREEKKNG